jgi:hypothetical protein
LYNLISYTTKAHFFDRLCDVVSPAACTQFSAFLQLVAEFAPLMVSHEEREGLRRTLGKESQSRLKRKRSQSLRSQDENAEIYDGQEPDRASSKKMKATAEETKDSKEPTGDDISFVGRVLLRLAEMLASAVSYFLSGSASRYFYFNVPSI